MSMGKRDLLEVYLQKISISHWLQVYLQSAWRMADGSTLKAWDLQVRQFWDKIRRTLPFASFVYGFHWITPKFWKKFLKSLKLYGISPATLKWLKYDQGNHHKYAWEQPAQVFVCLGQGNTSICVPLSVRPTAFPVPLILLSLWQYQSPVDSRTHSRHLNMGAS